MVLSNILHIYFEIQMFYFREIGVSSHRKKAKDTERLTIGAVAMNLLLSHIPLGLLLDLYIIHTFL